ncbi:Gfo/Idh/MocA family protein [Variovorax paradoxus]|jgi:predicted dehydrogenase|uniref:Gfo/Idh/MocA family protein n=1 Tax=Variovorax paradoxus TaxID=34073 RepID=UPI003393D08C
MSFTTPAIDDDSAAIVADPIATFAVPLPLDAPLAHAVVGLGRFGCVHARKLLALSGFHLRALVDCSSSARAASELAALPLLPSLDDLPPGIASVTVATSDDAHAEVAMALMRRGCHVLVEKPLCIDRHEGALMIRTARQCGVTLSTGHIERFNPVFDEAVLDRLRNAAASHSQGQQGRRPFMRFRRYSTRVATARDSVLDLMVHDIDLFAWLCAIPVEAPLEVLARHIGEQSIRARVRLGALIAEFESGYGSMPASARLHVCDGHREQLLDLRRSTATTTGDDALTRQYQGFRRAILGQASRVASGADGLVAVTRACQILHA